MLSTQFNRDNQHQAAATPSLLAACIALALFPSATLAVPTAEETVIVEGVCHMLQLMTKMITA